MPGPAPALVEAGLGLHGCSRIMSRIRTLLWWILCAAVSTMLLMAFARFSGVNHNEKAPLAAMLDGQAHRPYVTRALVPGLVNVLAALLSPAAKQAVNAQLNGTYATARLLALFAAPSELALQGMLTLGVMWLSLLGFGAALRSLMTAVYDGPPLTIDAVSLLVLCGLLPFFGFGYIYDFTVLWLFTLALALMVRRNWTAYLICFGLAALNKETTILLLIPFTLYHLWPGRRLARQSALKLLLGQLLIFGLIWLTLRLIYAGNPGEASEFHLGDHAFMLQTFPVLGGISTLSGIGLLVLMGLRPRQKPPFLIATALIFLPLLALFIPFGFPYEIRVFYEGYAAGALLVMQTLLGRRAWGLTPKPDPGLVRDPGLNSKPNSDSSNIL